MRNEKAEDENILRQPTFIAPRGNLTIQISILRDMGTARCARR